MTAQSGAGGLALDEGRVEWTAGADDSDTVRDAGRIQDA